MNMRKEILARLFELADDEYKRFNCPLIPTVDESRVIGVRTPALRALAAEVSKKGESGTYFALAPHYYYEENNLHGMLIERIRDYDDCVSRLDAFLPQVDNWATCDLIRPRCFAKNRARLIGDIRRWMESDHCYTVRFGLEMLMTHFLDEDFKAEYLELAASIKSEEYYVNMMVAWYFATALAKQWESTIVYITHDKLPLWVHNKSIQKAVESRRISEERKAYLRTLRRKE